MGKQIFTDGDVIQKCKSKGEARDKGAIAVLKVTEDSDQITFGVEMLESSCAPEDLDTVYKMIFKEIAAHSHIQEDGSELVDDAYKLWRGQGFMIIIPHTDANAPLDKESVETLQAQVGDWLTTFEDGTMDSAAQIKADKAAAEKSRVKVVQRVKGLIDGLRRDDDDIDDVDDELDTEPANEFEDEFQRQLDQAIEDLIKGAHAAKAEIESAAKAEVESAAKAEATNAAKTDEAKAETDAESHANETDAEPESSKSTETAPTTSKSGKTPSKVLSFTELYDQYDGKIPQKETQAYWARVFD